MRQYRRLARIVVSVVVGFAPIVVLFGCGAPAREGSGKARSSGEASGLPFRDFSPSQNAAFAWNLATRNGDARPSSVAMVDTSRVAALALISPKRRVFEGSAPANGSVRVFVMHGSFFYSGPKPPGASTPKGTWLTVSIDEATGKELDYALTSVRPELARLGVVKRLATPP
jgi:hypothetical protein